MKIFFILFAVTIAAAQAASILNFALEEWNVFKAQYNKYYSQLEEQFRLKVFFDSKNKIAKHNFKYEQGLVPFRMSVNKYADLLHDELVSTLNGFNRTRRSSIDEDITRVQFIPPANVELPESVDWRNDGAVTPVKDQGNCGSCWAFSATGALEGQHFRSTGKLVSLSEQNLMDCSGNHGNYGCDGGLIDEAFLYVKENNGIDTETSYPYEGREAYCRYEVRDRAASDVGFVDIPSGDEEKLKVAVATVGPISVAIDASHESFGFYSEGMYNEPECSSEILDHAVLVVGYGTDENGADYWLVKNSWGEDWGLNGYMKMVRNKNNHCGIATSASYPLV